MVAKKIEWTDSQKEWIKNNKLPEQFELTLPNNTKQTYRILNLNQNNHDINLVHRMGFKGFVLKVEDSITKRQYAAKVCLAEDYDNQRTELTEIQLTSQLANSDGLFAIPHSFGRIDYFEGMPIENDASQLVVFIVQWLEGTTIESIFNTSPDDIDPSWITKIAEYYLKAIQFLSGHNLKHDDLHLGNIMLVPQNSYLSLESEEPAMKVVIIDTGSLKQVTQDTKKADDDFSNYIRFLGKSHNTLLTNRYKATLYPHFISGLKKMIINLSDPDYARHYPNFIRDNWQEFKKLEKDPYINKKDALSFHPFDGISAEHLTDDNLLLELFVNNLSWIDDIKKPIPHLLTGPRGCGKSTIFRYLATKTHLAGNTPVYRDIPFFGVYISCSSELQNNFFGLSDKTFESNQKERIVTFFQIVVLKELFRTFALIEKDISALTHFGFSLTSLESAASLCIDMIPREFHKYKIVGTSILQHAMKVLEAFRLFLASNLRNNDAENYHFPTTAIAIITSHITEEQSERRIIFLLDDFTVSRIPENIQILLNAIIWERRGSHLFKVSCEMFGYTPQDENGIRIDAQREFIIIDAGARAYQEKTKKEFVANLLNSRLKAASWQGHIESLLGLRNFSDKDLALIIRNKTAGKTFYYYGLETLIQLWSGDIANLLHFAREIFREASINNHSTELIAKHTQHKAITSASNALANRVPTYYPYGKEIGAVMQLFGNGAAEILRQAPLADKHPKIVTRIEICTRNPNELIEELSYISLDASKIAKELLRRSIFIELNPSRSKDGGGIQTVRWQFRNALVPHFDISFSKTHYYDIKTLESLSEFLLNPKDYVNTKVMHFKDSKPKKPKIIASLFQDEEK